MSIQEEIRQEILRFNQLVQALESVGASVKKIFENGYIITPSGAPYHEEKSVWLTLMAVTHGNEVAGISVLCEIASHLLRGGAMPSYPFALCLGNPEASLVNKRFVERDLNRSFGRKGQDTLEDKRARELESLLSQTAYLLDIHQTIEPSEKPFFIFPYSPKSFEWARQLDQTIPIVTHWGPGFSKDGMCSDEFTNSRGGLGITIELGQNGFDIFRVSVGFKVAIQAMGVCKSLLEKQNLYQSDRSMDLYTWGQIIPWPDGEACLDEGWYNFKEVKSGARIGSANGSDILAECSGPVLFPKYSSNPRPAEICRILKRIKPSDLGKN